MFNDMGLLPFMDQNYQQKSLTQEAILLEFITVMQYMYYRYMQTHLGSYLECSKVEKNNNKVKFDFTCDCVPDIVYL